MDISKKILAGAWLLSLLVGILYLLIFTSFGLFMLSAGSLVGGIVLFIAITAWSATTLFKGDLY